MGEGARVNSLDAIKEFRVYLVKFQESANLALGDADSDINKIQTWLEGEQQTYWTGQIRKRQEILVKAEDAYRQKKLYKDSSGSTPSAVEEQKAVNIAKKNLAEAQQKLANVKQWQRRFQKELVLYRGGVARFANTVSSGIPQAVGQLSGYLEQLEKYMGIGVGGEPAGTPDTSMAGAMGSGRSGPSMARAPDTAPAAPNGPGVDALRAVVPAEKELTAAIPTAATAVLPSIPLPAAQLQAVETLSAGAAPSAAKIVWPDNLDITKPIVLSHVPAAGGTESIWYAGPVEAAAPPGYNVTGIADLLSNQPALRLLLSLPSGFIIAVDPTGITAIFDQNDRSRWDQPAR